MNSKRTVWIIAAVLGTLLAGTAALWGTGGEQESQALGPGTQPDSRYSLSSAGGLEFQTLHDGKRLDVYFTDSASYTVNGIYVTFLFDHSVISVDSIDTCQSHGYYDFSDAGEGHIVLDTSHSGMAIVKIWNFTAAHFTNTKIFGLWVRSDCLPGSRGITIADSTDFPTYSICQFNMSNGSNKYLASRDSGYVSLITPTKFITFNSPIAESTYVGGQVKVPLRVLADFPPWDSILAVVEYDTAGLKYDSTSFVGTWASSGLYVDTMQNTIKIHKGENSLAKPGTYQTMAYIFWTVKDAIDDSTFHSIEVDHGNLFACDSYGGSVSTGDASCVKVPKYDATVKVDTVTAGRCVTGVRVPVHVKNNFPILFKKNASGGIAFHFISADHYAYFQWPKDYDTVYVDSTVSPKKGYWIAYTCENAVDSGLVIRSTSNSYDSTLNYSPQEYQRFAYVVFDANDLGEVGTDTIKLIYSTGAYAHQDFYFLPAHGADTLFAYAPEKIHRINGRISIQEGSYGCPYLFAWDGERFAEENTIAGYADNSVFAKATPDLYRMKTCLKAKDGRYSIQIREFENEESHFDNFALKTVDHPEGTTVNATRSGKIALFRSELFPMSAVDEAGADHVSEIAYEDGIFFSSDEPGTLILTYSTGKSFDWDFAALSDEPPPPSAKYYPPQQKPVATNPIITSGPVTTELLSHSGEWIRVDSIANRATDYTDAPTFSPSDFVQHGKIVVRKRWETRFYVDRISFLLPAKEKPEIIDLPLAAAKHNTKGDIYSQVAGVDGQMASLIPGETIELAFMDVVNAPPKPGYVRDFVFKSVGYYTAYKGRAAVPETYQLLQNYPNPFNPSTAINYNLIATTEVNLTIYNMLGQKVKTLVDGTQEQGRHSVIWDGTDDGGREAPSGIYLYKLTTPQYSASRKMMLIK